jgi:hypothetical protein
MLPLPLQNDQVRLVELILEPDDTPRVTFAVTDSVHLCVPVDIDPDLVAAIVDAICRC